MTSYKFSETSRRYKRHNLNKILYSYNESTKRVLNTKFQQTNLTLEAVPLQNKKRKPNEHTLNSINKKRKLNGKTVHQYNN